MRFCRKVKQLVVAIKKDIARYEQTSNLSPEIDLPWLSVIKLLLRHWKRFGLQAIVVYRIRHFLRKESGLGIIGRIIDFPFK